MVHWKHTKEHRVILQLWRTGIGQKGPKPQNPDTWLGQNLLGFASTDVLKKNNATNVQFYVYLRWTKRGTYHLTTPCFPLIAFGTESDYSSRIQMML